MYWWSGYKRYIDKDGYVRVTVGTDHPMAHVCGRAFEHRLVMAEHLGRPLRSDERVHHKNGDRTDNRIENLELWLDSHPSGQRVEDKVRWARAILDRYDRETAA